jgi:hypothetical protein
MIMTLINLIISAIGMVGIILLGMFTIYVIISYVMGRE